MISGAAVWNDRMRFRTALRGPLKSVRAQVLRDQEVSEVKKGLSASSFVDPWELVSDEHHGLPLCLENRKVFPEIPTEGMHRPWVEVFSGVWKFRERASMSEKQGQRSTDCVMPLVPLVTSARYCFSSATT